MKKQSSNRYGFRGILAMALMLLGLGTSSVQAQDIKINARPLTPQEILDYSLPGATQTSGGAPVVGLGQPVYLELLVKAGTVVTQAVWNLDEILDLDGEPIENSMATITNSPLPMSMPTYDSVDRVAFDVIDRAVIVPDKKGTYYISAQAVTSNETLNASFEVVGSVFIGQNSACSLCHATKQDGFNMTRHSTALKASINDPAGHFQAFCIKCHAVGYDTTPGAVNDGFDDIAKDLNWTFPPLATNNWDNLPDALKLKSNVQCENCHGPAQEHMRTGGDTSKISISVSAGNCGQCHDAVAHHTKNFEWGTSLHGRTEVDRTGVCTACHTTAGFIDANDPGMNEDGDFVAVRADFKEGITCAACHDPHGPGNGVHQTRAISSVELGNGDVITEGGAGLVCMSCHKSRRDAESYVYGNASSHFGPHHGPQADLLAGKNAIQYGQVMPSSTHGVVIENSCAECHMQETPADLPPYAKNRVGGHSFTLSYNDGTNAPIHLTEACAGCHGELEDFDFGGEDYNRDGVIEGVQTEIHHLLDELGMLLPPYGSPDVVVGSAYNTLELKRGVYNYLFIEEDGSHGVHNPKYAAAILRASIDDLTGGIDIDRDGLLDSWEIENFGNLTSQSGKDDYDGDGLNNMAEMKLGTNAKLADSDGDGFSDLVELQGNSDPLDIDSVPSSDLIMLPAAEIGYMPKGTGTLVSIQMASDLTDGVWTNVGDAQMSNGNWVYQLDSMRGTTNRFYRAIEE
jgi:nitrate/TMAO reductase-like tetraheme cytochrome c subunit